MGGRGALSMERNRFVEGINMLVVMGGVLDTVVRSFRGFGLDLGVEGVRGHRGRI